MSVTGSDLTIANLNPIRYRGYYYDGETGLYHLMSRYYDPVVGRFLNADILISTRKNLLGVNAFAYCFNSPVMYSDSLGTDAILLLDSDAVGNLGHTGLLIQDENGCWYHMYWERTGTFGFVFGEEKHSPQIKLFGNFVGIDTVEEINMILSTKTDKFDGQSIHRGQYEELTYYEGDFTASLEYARNYSARYNLVTNNCSQLSFEILQQSQAIFGKTDNSFPKVAFYTHRASRTIFATLETITNTCESIIESILKRSVVPN